MLRFLIAILFNAKRGPQLVSAMRKMIKHKDKYPEKTRYALALKLIRYLKKSARITTEVYGTENLPSEGGYVMYPNVNIVTEMTNMIDAERAYQANATAFNASKAIATKGLEIGRT